MKLFRFGPLGAEKPGVLLSDDRKIDVSKFTSDYNEFFFTNDGIPKLRSWLEGNASQCPLVTEDQRMGACIARPSKIICIGLNYAMHAAESGMETPKEPIIFFKATSALSGPFDSVVIPKNSEKTDWEVELAIIIGRRATYVDEANALDYVAGYAIHNDISERAFQLEKGGQWVKGKSADTFAPFGPYLVTKDEINAPENLNLWLKLNGQLLQNSNTSDLIFGIPHLISYLSNYMTLLPGDVISTGTPSGVGMGLKPPRYLVEGDIMELGIQGLGIAKQTVRNYK